MPTRTYLSLGLLYTTTLVAGTMGAEEINIPYKGFYLGGDIGVANIIDNQSTPTPNSLFLTNEKRQFSSTGLVGGGLLGYDFCLGDRSRMGLEGFINAAGLNLTARQLYAPITSFDAKMRYYAGVRALPGYEFSPGTVGHILLGYSYGHFRITDDGSYGYLDNSLGLNGFQAGLGVNVGCNTHLSVRGDLIYTTYASNLTLGTTPGFIPQNYFNHFSTIEADLSLIYKFNE